MTEKLIKLINRGKRTIIHKGFHFKPEALVEFPEEDAALIRKLFKDEVQSPEDTAEVFAAQGETFAAEDSVLEAAVKKASKSEKKTKGEDFADK